MKWIAMLVALLMMCSPVLAQIPAPAEGAQGKPAHDREFWRSIVKNRYAVPEGQSVFPLLRELSGYLGSRDSELRDDLAYTIIAVWIKHEKQLSATELNSLVDEWRTNLQVGVGESVSDGVLKRSFSALCLAAMAERDLKMPFLSEERYRTLLADALAYLQDERDLRGFDAASGWIHATAHTADLLAALVSNPLFKSEDEGRVLNAISGRLSSAHEIFRYGEQDRLALVAGGIARRKDSDTQAFRNWLTALDAADQRVWQDSPPKLELLQTFENDTYMLRGLAVYLCTSTPNPAVAEVQNAVMRSLQKR